MQLQIDPRAGSEKLIAKFPGECEATTLEFGDIAFFGNGPDNVVWYIGIEYKQLDDLVACIKSGRLTGTQLPGMMNLYDLSLIIVEGIAQPEPDTGRLMRYRGGGGSYGMRIGYSSYDNFLTSIAVFSTLSGKPCIVKTSSSIAITVQMIRDIYELFQKPWSEHKAFTRPDCTKMERVSFNIDLIDIKPEDPDYPKHVLRKSVFQVDRIGWDVAGAIAEKFSTMENALAASQKEWQTIDHVGPLMADRVYRAFHGRSDPEAQKKKRKSKELA